LPRQERSLAEVLSALAERDQYMAKKVRYAFAAAAGAVPALGLLAQPATAALAPPHAAKQPARPATKSVRNSLVAYSRTVAPLASTCTATKEYVVFTSSVHLKFWSKPSGSHTCIGTIETSYVGPNANKARARVVNQFGTFCQATTNGAKITDGCHHVFRRASLRVSGSELHANGVPFAVASNLYPFINNPF
jgi:hypothetical protein